MKIISLLKACMTENMSIFKIKTRKQSDFSRKIIPVILAIVLFGVMMSYSEMIIEPLVSIHFEFLLLTLFVLITSFLTLIEGIYKSSSLLFNCKDDSLLFALPIKKSTVLFIRVFKFYVFELLYNSLFLVPAMVVYVRNVNVEPTFYIVSIIACFLLPIIPIIISNIIGAVISAFSSHFKFKNIIQIIVTTIFLLAVCYFSYNIDNIFKNIAENATSINDYITKMYYPAGAYIKMITDFNITDLLFFIIINISLFTLSIIILSKVYFKINSNVKSVKVTSNNKKYKIKSNSIIKSLVKKELNRFINSPVFVINAGFGLVLFIVGAIGICVKYDYVANIIISQGIDFSIEQIGLYMPVILFGFICLASLMSSITSSMISLEGKSFNILKSLPVDPFKIIMAKVLTAMLIMLPFILVGDLIFFIKFEFNIYEIMICLIASFVLPLFAETIGILVNLKYPKMDAENDTEVVKQSMSSMVAVFFGMICSGITIALLYKGIDNGLGVDKTISLGLVFYFILTIGLMIYMKNKSVEHFNNINK